MDYKQRTFRLGFMADDPDIGALTKQIRELERTRNDLIVDRMLGRTRTHLNGFDYVTDPSLPENVLEMRDKDGRVLARITNLG